MFAKKPKGTWDKVKDGWDSFTGQIKGAVMSGAREGAKIGVKQAVKAGVRDAVKEGIIIEAARQAQGREDALVSEGLSAEKPSRKLLTPREREPV